MKTLILISALLVSNLIFGQQKEISFELASPFGYDLDEFPVFLSPSEKFVYLPEKTFEIYCSTMDGGRYQEDPNNVKNVIDLKGVSIDKFYTDEKNNKNQIITGYYQIEIDAKDTVEIHKILSSSRSNQEILEKISDLKGVNRPDLKNTTIIETFNPSIKGAQYYTIKGFYYTIDKYDDGGYYIAIIFPMGKDRRFN